MLNRYLPFYLSVILRIAILVPPFHLLERFMRYTSTKGAERYSESITPISKR